MTISIQEITDRTQWNDFQNSHGGHIKQSYEWGELTKFLGGRIYRLGAFEDGRQIGAMLLSVIALPLPVSVPGVHFNWLYAVNGPTIEHPDSPALPALVEHTHMLAKKEHAVVLRLDPNIGDDNPEQDRWLAAYHRLGFSSNTASGSLGRRTWVLDIRPNAEKLLADLKMTWRQNVRVSERKGVIVREAKTEADFDAFYELFKLTSERDDFFIHGKAYTKEVIRQFADQGNAVVLLAEHEGEPLAGKVLLRYGDCCYDMFGASSNNKRNLKATYLIQFRSFLWAKEVGCSWFDFRTIPDVLQPGEEMWGVYEFKKGFGGFARLILPSQDYIYRPMVYWPWRKSTELRRIQRHKERQRVELERAARGKADAKPEHEQQSTDAKASKNEKATKAAGNNSANA